MIKSALRGGFFLALLNSTNSEFNFTETICQIIPDALSSEGAGQCHLVKDFVNIKIEERKKESANLKEYPGINSWSILRNPDGILTRPVGTEYQ